MKNNQTSYTPQFQTLPTQPLKKEMFFGIHPLHNPQRMLEIFGPIIENLSQQIPEIQFTLEASRDYDDYNKKLYARKFHFALPNPYQTIKAIDHGYHVFGKMGDDFNFRGIIVVRKDSGINSIKDLKGKKISFPAPTALAASMMTQYFLQTHGIDVKKDIQIVYVGSQESSILSVAQKETSAGSTWIPPWKILSEEKPELQNELRILVETESLINNSLMYRDDIDPKIVEKIKNILFHLHENEKGRDILKKLDLSKFESADNSTFKPIYEFLKKYNSLMGAIE